MPQVKLVHVEVETVPCIAEGQKLYPQVSALLQEFGFVEVASDQPRSYAQFNAVFVRSRLSPELRLRRGVLLTYTRARALAVTIALWLCAPCVRRYQGMRRRHTSPS